MAVTAWKEPGTVESIENGDGTNWTDPDNAKTYDTNYAICDKPPAGGQTSDYLRTTNYGFTTDDIPDGSTIDGIETELIQTAESEGNVYPQTWRLCLDGAWVVGEVVLWGFLSSETTHTDPDDAATNDWGWAGQGKDDADIRNSTFGHQFSVGNNHASQPREGRVDRMRIRVYYTAPSSSYTPQIIVGLIE